jgi:hypothetical protein
MGRREAVECLSDGTRICCDCAAAFTITSGERDHYAALGFALPRRCAACRKMRKALRQQEAIDRGRGGDIARGDGR